MQEQIYDIIANMINKSKMALVLTGAGISTESGIPDFRSPGTGLWERVDPMEVLSADVLYNDPEEFYKTGFRILTEMKGAKPNKAHLILNEMEKLGVIKGIITQNIDNLHYEAGSRNIVEVHGHIRSGHCINCMKSYKLREMEEKVESNQIPPLCLCGGIIRPDVVLFGDSLPECFNEAWEMSKKCDLMVVIGSSLQVGPVNQLPALAKGLVIINYGQTMYDRRAEVVCREKASYALEKIYNKLREIRINE